MPGDSASTGNANLICLNEVIYALEKLPDLVIDIAGDVLKKGDAFITATKPIEYVKKIINWPVVNPHSSEQCYADILKHLDQYAYDAMLVMHMPYDGVLAAVKAKKKHPDVKLIMYELDPITYEIDKQRKSLGRYLYFMRIFAEKRTFQICDVILHMECNRKKYEHKRYDVYRDKFVYLDFPLIHYTGQQKSEGRKDGQSFRFIYTGKLMSHFRSPMYLLQVLAEVWKKVDLQVIFFSQGDCERAISEFAETHSFVQQRGYVSKKELQQEIDASDCLINIGNKISDMLPSKLLTYIETGMPILHVRNQENDACIPYLKKYDLALIIDEKDPVEVSAEKMIAFIQNSIGKRLGSDWIVKTYRKNTPEYSAQCIYEMLNRK